MASSRQLVVEIPVAVVEHFQGYHKRSSHGCEAPDGTE
ncbi:hypothetical protein TIFTF001_029093 [Ficus carica]|uniref:Uncharacterized protein n=1 Tax=Ficus carica TaxID=3494 RepID=A0AA88DRI5_FICCA|nr:hypothetical protein TIFTF001_029093 [Ficus carica]